MTKKNCIYGIVLTIICVLQIVTIVSVNDICDRLGRMEYSIRIVPSDLRKSSFTNKDTAYSPITIREDNPEIPYDDYVPSDQVVSKDLRGTAYNPEGPAGVEGQNPPVYSEMSNIIETN